MNINDLSTPAAVVDLDRLERNATRMADHAHDLGVRLRPHVKTHKCVEAARIQIRDHFGGITVSTLAEARGFAAAGFRDITYAVPVAPQKLAEVVEINSRIDRLSVLVDHMVTISAIEETARSHAVVLPVWLKIDCGLHRAGVDPASDHAIGAGHPSSELGPSSSISAECSPTPASPTTPPTEQRRRSPQPRERAVSRAFVNRWRKRRSSSPTSASARHRP